MNTEIKVLLDKCVVDSDNIFTFSGQKFLISNSVKEYRVLNSYKDNKEYTNTATMCTIGVFLNTENNRLEFYDENDVEVKKVKIVRGV